MISSSYQTRCLLTLAEMRVCSYYYAEQLQRWNHRQRARFLSRGRRVFAKGIGQKGRRHAKPSRWAP